MTASSHPLHVPRLPRTLWRLLRLALHLGRGMLTVALVYPWIDDARRLALKQRWSRQLANRLGVTIKVGADNTASEAPQGFLVANHISFLDIFVINALAPAAFVAKDDVRNWPLLGWLSQRTETIFLERGSRRAAQAAREHLVEQLRAGRLVAVFPEGTTSDGHAVLPFHAALFQSAIDAGVPVTPVVLRYADASGRRSHAADYVGDTSLVACLWSIAGAGSLTAHVELLPALSSSDINRRHLAAHAHRLISHALKHAPDPEASPSPMAGLVADTAGETPADPPVAPPSMYRPKDSLYR